MKKIKAFTLAEMAIAVMIAGLSTGSVWVGYWAVANKLKQKDAVGQVLSFIEYARSESVLNHEDNVIRFKDKTIVFKGEEKNFSFVEFSEGLWQIYSTGEYEEVIPVKIKTGKEVISLCYLGSFGAAGVKKNDK